ncbi:branched-chain amino acid ABC transporter permease [Pseudonocardia thermophila]|jgi:Branched-chain amino acid ABC-type transport system, permease components|uniref:branched-chain amino acid ABC transporter permease n=1 Tax=Pseudonocardia thermophila TaxID=1848 RepID=UPI00248E1892|nr:branched-chain amino acid ABC transporter permease [Pseudonocardia thermophila]
MAHDLLNLLVLWSVYLLFALGMSVVWGSIGVLNFAHGATFMFSAFTGHLISTRLDLGVVPTVLLCLLVGAGLAVVAHFLIVEPVLRATPNVAAAELRVLIASIGVAAVLLAIAQTATRSAPFGFAPVAVPLIEVAGVRISLIQLLIIALGLGVSLGVAVLMRTSRFGIALRGIGLDPETASLMGVDRTRLAAAVMGVAGALAGLAGALLTYHLGSIVPETGDLMVIKAFAAIVLGGLGNVYGVILGTFVLAVAETAVLTYTPGTWVDAVSFGLILLVLLVRPHGLLGRAEVRRT